MKKLYLKNGAVLGMRQYFPAERQDYYFTLINDLTLLSWFKLSDVEIGYTIRHTLSNDYYFHLEKIGETSVTCGFYTPTGTLIDGMTLHTGANNYIMMQVEFLDNIGKGNVFVTDTENLEYGPSEAVTSEHPVRVDWTTLLSSSVYPNSIYIDSRNFVIDFNNLPDMDWTKPDPYKNGGVADIEGAGGGGTFDTSSDVVPLPNLPEKTALSSGFISIYTPLAGELISLSQYMWSDTFIDGVKKLYANPSDSLIMLGIIPINIPSVIDSDVKIGGISTGITMHKATAQFIEVDCGTITLNEFFGSCFDYQPYTQLQLYCPFSGYHDIDVDVCMSKSLNLRYKFDILSGTFVAYLLVNNSVMYQWSGQALTVLPTSAYNIDALIKGAVATTASVAGAVATGGALAPIAGAMTVASVTSMKPNVSHGGSVSSSAALLSVRQPHVIIKRPRQVLPTDYNKTSGYPAMYTATLSDLTGYTEIYNIHLEDMSCTDNEKTEIERLLKEGVII